MFAKIGKEKMSLPLAARGNSFALDLLVLPEQFRRSRIHQMAFAAEEETPVPVMLDTVNIPPGRMLPNPGDPNFPLIQPSRTRIVLDFRNVPRGEFVYHCHMLFHEDNGMMGVIRVI